MESNVLKFEQRHGHEPQVVKVMNLIQSVLEVAAMDEIQLAVVPADVCRQCGMSHEAVARIISLGRQELRNRNAA